MNKLLILIILLYVCGCKQSPLMNEQEEFPTCVIQVDQVKEELDISELFTDSLEIIRLETNDNCLVSDIKKMQCTKEHIYIADATAERVFQFSNSGKFIRSIGQKGEGATEYSSMGVFAVREPYLYIQDVYGKRILRYHLHDNRVDVLPLQHVSMDEMIVFDSCMYCVSNYRGLHDGKCHNLHKICFPDLEQIPLLVADGKVAEKHSAWGLNRFASVCNDSALVIYPLNDTIYTVTQEGVYPTLKVAFSARTLPQEMRYQDVMETMKHYREYILGMDGIRNTPRYIFFEYMDLGKSKNVLIDKATLTGKTAKWFVLNRWGGLYLTDFDTCDNSLLIAQQADFYMNLWKHIYSQNEFKNPQDRKAMEEVFEHVGEDDNPVIVKLKFK